MQKCMQLKKKKPVGGKNPFAHTEVAGVTAVFQ